MKKSLPSLINNEDDIDDKVTGGIDRQLQSPHSTTNDKVPGSSPRQISKMKKSRHLDCDSSMTSKVETTVSKKGRKPASSLAAKPQKRVYSHFEYSGSNTASSSRKECSDFDVLYYESYDPNAPPFDRQTCKLKFSCTVGDCKMILSNNVSFIFHLWAHLSEFNYSTTGFMIERELDQLYRCPQCLRIFPTPYEMQFHFGNVHGPDLSAPICRICEIVIKEPEHWKIHHKYDIPYHCRKCRYRTSIRNNFIDHFVRFHSYTRILLCPFCLAYFRVSDTNASIVRESEYVKHFFQHQRESYRCNQCSLRFIDFSDKIAHKKDHIEPDPNWVTVTARLHTRRKGRYEREEPAERCCIECKEPINDVLAHFKDRYNCSYCHYETYCRKAYDQHVSIDCRIERKGLNSNHLLKEVVICDNCNRASCNRDILNHIRECSGGSCTVATLKQDEKTLFSHLSDEFEAKLFALRPASHYSDLDDKSFSRSHNIVPPDSTISFSKAYMELYQAHYRYV
ncbi:unnamed protein product [Thelazia callipaeda]|uniref:C2H2-type domain-containing protein n=1 Tax=Thelazia callipaeda TaxID=103827 RepID=A0A0N5DB50_THECL|nr:unnamed protein product [Thelazia callipaeda]